MSRINRIQKLTALALFTLAPCVATHGVTSGLVGYYNFESSLTNGGSAGASLNATVITGSPTTGSAGGLVGNALDLDKAQTDAIRVAATTANLGQNFTISTWFKNELAGTDTTRSYVFEAANNFDISFGTPGNTTGPDNYTSYVAQAGAVNVSLNRNVWNHVVHAFGTDGTTTTLNSYINGTLTNTLTAPTANMSFTDINFGTARNGAGRYFEGKMDEIAIWNRTLSASEVTEITARGQAGYSLTESVVNPKYVFNADVAAPNAHLGATIALTGWTDAATFTPVAGANNDLGDGGFADRYYQTTGAGLNALTITLNNLESHNAIDLGMVIAQLDSLDGFRSDLDRMIIRLDGVEIFNAQLSYGTSVSGTFVDGTGTQFISTGDPALDAELLALRTISNTNVFGGADFRENLYDLSKLSIFKGIAHSSSTLTLEIIGDQNQASGEFFGVDNISITLVTTIPEPTSLSLLALSSLTLMRRRR